MEDVTWLFSDVNGTEMKIESETWVTTSPVSLLSAPGAMCSMDLRTKCPPFSDILGTSSQTGTSAPTQETRFYLGFPSDDYPPVGCPVILSAA